MQTISRKLFIILGGGNISHSVAIAAIKSGYNVVVTTRASQPKDYACIKYVPMPTSMFNETFGVGFNAESFWKHFTEIYSENHQDITIVNTIGTPISDDGCTLQEINCEIPFAIMKTIHEKAQTMGKTVKTIHLSSGATILESAYGATKKAMEKRLLDSSMNVTILRPMYVVKPWTWNTNTFYYKGFHRLSVEEMSALPLSLMLGDPKKTHQTTLSVIGIDDLVEGIMKIADKLSGPVTIDAINDEILSQEQLMQFHCDLIGKKYRPMYLSTNAAMFFAKNHEFGHLTPYTIEYCEKSIPSQCSAAFEKILGRKLKTLYEIYQGYPHQSELMLPKSCFPALTKHIIGNMWRKPEIRAETAKMC